MAQWFLLLVLLSPQLEQWLLRSQLLLVPRLLGALAIAIALAELDESSICKSSRTSHTSILCMMSTLRKLLDKPDHVVIIRVRLN